MKHPCERFGHAGIRHVWILAALFAFGYAVFGVTEHRRFATSYDLGIFDQAVWHLSRFEAPASSISDYPNVLADHFYPIIALLAPLYWIAPAPETLIVSQALLLAASIVPVFLFLRGRLAHGPALALSAAYGCYWGIQQAAAFDFHEMAFAPLLIASAILAMDRTNWRLFWSCCLVLMLVKEDLIPILTFLGLYLVGHGERRRGLLLLASSLAAFFLIVGVLIPALSEAGRYNYAGAYADILRRPWTILVTLVTPLFKLRTMILWFAPFLFLSLRSPLSVLLVPIALERFLSSSPFHWGTAFHYSAPVAPIVAMSAGDGLARAARRLAAPQARHRLVSWMAGVSVVLSALLPGRQPLWRLLSPARYQATASTRAGHRALALVPREASVVAQAALLPHLSQRRDIRMLETGAADADIVIAGGGLSPWPFETDEALARELGERRDRGYRVLFEAQGWIVLRASPTSR